MKTVVSTVKLYADDPLQKDWDVHVENLMFALNTAHYCTRKETPFFLVHGWDANNTLEAMVPSGNVARISRSFIGHGAVRVWGCF